MKTKDALIHPEDAVNLLYWTKKWGVSIQRLHDAILYTGSVNPTKVKEYLKKDTRHYSPIAGLFKIFGPKN